MLLKLKKKIKTEEDMLSFVDKLIICLKNEETISDNKMIDGFMIGLIYSNSKYISLLFLSNIDLPPMSDNSIQQLEQCYIWISKNEKKLVEIYNKK
jgi:hypothetical protein